MNQIPEDTAVVSFANGLKSFDAYYDYSDDIRVYRAGKAAETALLTAKKELTPAQIVAAYELAGKPIVVEVGRLVVPRV